MKSPPVAAGLKRERRFGSFRSWCRRTNCSLVDGPIRIGTSRERRLKRRAETKRSNAGAGLEPGHAAAGAAASRSFEKDRPAISTGENRSEVVGRYAVKSCRPPLSLKHWDCKRTPKPHQATIWEIGRISYAASADFVHRTIGAGFANKLHRPHQALNHDEFGRFVHSVSDPAPIFRQVAVFGLHSGHGEAWGAVLRHLRFPPKDGRGEASSRRKARLALGFS